VHILIAKCKERFPSLRGSEKKVKQYFGALIVYGAKENEGDRRNAQPGATHCV